MTPSLAEELRTQAIYNTQQLLDATCTPSDREALAERVGVEARSILELANRADLSRVRGVAGVYSDLLEQAGVDTVRELAARNPNNLHAKLLEVNAQKRVAGRAPSRSMVERWIAQAQQLPRQLKY
jgi:predicted flap endonuclease-1-like 5' DNA nuclease